MLEKKYVPYTKEMIDREYEFKRGMLAAIRDEIILSESFWESGMLQGLRKPINLQANLIVKENLI